MRTIPQRMTIEEFELLPRCPGWKHEYWGGRAYVQPRPSVAIVRAPVIERPVIVPDGFLVRPVTPDDALRLRHAYYDAFRNSIDYWGYSRAAIRQSASESIDTFFSGKRGPFHPVSRLAVAPTGRSIAGAALLVEGIDSPNLDLLFVRPRWQRRGLASVLGQSVMNVLSRQGTALVGSGYTVGNEASEACHRQMGFVELPDLMRARDEAGCARHALWRAEQMGGVTENERQRLEQNAAHWQARAEELEAIAEREGWDAVSPLRRQRRQKKSTQ